jgi:hypothetical protein
MERGAPRRPSMIRRCPSPVTQRLHFFSRATPQRVGALSDDARSKAAPGTAIYTWCRLRKKSRDGLRQVQGKARSKMGAGPRSASFSDSCYVAMIGSSHGKAVRHPRGEVRSNASIERLCTVFDLWRRHSGPECSARQSILLCLSDGARNKLNLLNCLF